MKNNSEEVMEEDRRWLEHKVHLNFNKVILLQSTDKVLIEKKKKKNFNFGIKQAKGT